MSDHDASRLSRRELALRSAIAGGVLLSGGLLAACGGDGTADTATTTTTGATGAPKKGGVLRVGISGGGSNDTLNPANMVNYPDNIRGMALYDFLVNLDADAKPTLALAEEMEPNAKGDVWTVRIRDGLEFHNGKTADADDLIFSYQNIGYWAGLFKAAYGFDAKTSLKKIDDRTVRFTLDRPYSVFRESLMATFPAFRPVGYDPKKPVGAGPFMFKSFSPGEQSVFVANPNYWGDGPYVDELHIINFTEDTARVNALLAGQVDVIDNIPSGQIAAIKQNKAFELLSVESANWQPITMRVDKAPFDDVRVRKAFRLMQDRDQLLELAVAGQGAIGNDLHNRYDVAYPDLPQRKQDLEQAKSLLKQAGREGLSVELVTSPIQRGVVEMSQVFAQQAAGAGVDVKVTKLDPTAFFSDQYLKRPFSVDWWILPIEYLSTVGLAELPGAPANATHFDNPKFTALYAEATATLDEQKRGEIVGQMQQISYDEGGYMISYFPSTVDAKSQKTVGWTKGKTGIGLNGGRLNLISFA